MKSVIIAVLGIFVMSSVAIAGDEPFVTSDVLRVRRVTAVDVAREGQVAVFVVRSIAETRDPDADGAAAVEHEYRSHLFVADLFDLAATPRQLTFGDRKDGAPALSPDGRRVAFVREAAEENENGERPGQIWLLSLAGGEARQITSMERGARNPRWSPDGLRLLVQSPVPFSELEGSPPWPTERPERAWRDAETGDGPDAVTPRPDGSRAEIRAWLARNAGEHDPFVITRLDFQGEHGLEEEMTFTHLFLLDPRDDAAAPVRLTNGFHDHDDPRFVGDGRRIVYVSENPADEHLDRELQEKLRMIDVDGSNDRLVLQVEGMSVRSPRPSLDGSLLAFVAESLDEPMYEPQRLGFASIADAGVTDPVWLTGRDTFDRSVHRVDWIPAESSLVFTTDHEGVVPLMNVSMGLLEPAPIVERIGDEPAGVGVFGVGGGSIVYAVTTPSNPCTLRVRDGRGDRELADLNPWVADKRLAVARADWISRPDGTRVQCWIMEPTNRVEGETYPLVLEMHGGPGVMWGPSEFTMWHEFQLLCSWGYGVVYANPRGSEGYGYEFLRGNHENWGQGPAGDVLAAVDRAMEEPWVDPDRLVITGGSYAGYLTAWIVGNDRRFKAAVAQRGVYDLETFFGEGNAWRLVPWAMGGYPWEARTRTVLQRESPFTYVNRIRTPLLIMHASDDLRTGVSQSEMMYRALKELRRPVEYVRYPGAGHDLSRTGHPRDRMDRLNRIIEFFERYIDNPRPAPRAGAT